MKTMAVVALSGYDALAEDIDFIGSLAGTPAASQQLEQMILMFTQNQGLVGLDKSKPIGAIVQSDGMTFGGALCLPVSDLEKFLGALQALGVTSEDQGDGITLVSARGQDLFAKSGDGWVFFAPMQEMLEGLPDDPSKMFAPLTKQYDLGIRAYVQNIPDAYRQMAILQLQAGMDAATQRLPNESDEAFQQRKDLTALQIEPMKQMINELEEFTIGLAIDSKQQRTFLDVAYTAVAGSDLAAKISLNSNSKTNYAGFFQPDAALMFSFASKVSEADIAQMDQMFEALRKQIGTAIDDEETNLPSDAARDVLKSALGDFLDAIKATAKSGKMDGGAVLNLAPESATFVAGGYSADPSKLESGLKKLLELAKEEPDFPGIQWNSAKHTDVSFHTLNVPIPEDNEQPRQLFGESLEIAIGIGKQSVYFALGRDCLEAVKGVIDRSAKSPGKSVSPMEMTFALGQIMDVAASLTEGAQQQTVQMIAGMLTNEAAGRDHVRIVVQPIPNGLRTRIELEEGVLRAIGMGAMLQQQQAQPVGAGL